MLITFILFSYHRDYCSVLSGFAVTGLYNQSLVIACVSHTSDSQCALQDSQHNNVVTAGGNRLESNQKQQLEQRTKELSQQTHGRIKGRQ